MRPFLCYLRTYKIIANVEVIVLDISMHNKRKKQMPGSETHQIQIVVASGGGMGPGEATERSSVVIFTFDYSWGMANT